MTAEGTLPGPRGLPLLGSLIAFRLDTNGFLLELVRRYGDLASFQLGRRRAFPLNHPELVKDALVANRFRFGKGALMLRARRLLGAGGPAADGRGSAPVGVHRVARMSAVLTLATLTRRWRPRLVPGHRVEPQTLITLRPRYGMKMTLERWR